MRLTRVTATRRGEIQIQILAGKVWTGTVIDGEEADRLIDELTNVRLKLTSGRCSP